MAIEFNPDKKYQITKKPADINGDDIYRVKWGDEAMFGNAVTVGVNSKGISLKGGNFDDKENIFGAVKALKSQIGLGEDISFKIPKEVGPRFVTES